MAELTSTALQQALYNPYYGMRYAKGGVTVKLCGYMYGIPLNTDHSDNTCFIVAESDKRSTKPFLMY